MEIDYNSVEEAVKIIAQATRATGAIGRGFASQGWDTLIYMRDDVDAEVLERGVRSAYKSWSEDNAEDEDGVGYNKNAAFVIAETERRALGEMDRFLRQPV